MARFKNLLFKNSDSETAARDSARIVMTDADTLYFMEGADVADRYNAGNYGTPTDRIPTNWVPAHYELVGVSAARYIVPKKRVPHVTLVGSQYITTYTWEQDTDNAYWVYQSTPLYFDSAGVVVSKSDLWDYLSSSSEYGSGSDPSVYLYLHTLTENRIRRASLSKTNLSGGPSALYYDIDSEQMFIDSECTTQLAKTTITHDGLQVEAFGPIVTPSKVATTNGGISYKYNGFYGNSASDAETLYIDQGGYVLPALVSAVSALAGYGSVFTVKATGEAKSKRFTLTPNNSSSEEKGTPAIYCPYDGSAADRTQWFDGPMCEGAAISYISLPGYVTASIGKVFNGYKYSSKTYINADGTLGSEMTSTSSNVWQATGNWLDTKKVTVKDGTDTIGAFYYCSTSTSWWLESGGRLVSAMTGDPAKNMVVPPTKDGYAFAGCRKSNDDTSALRVLPDGEISSDTSVATWPPTAAQTVYARWTRISYPVTFTGASETETPTLYAKVGGGLYRDVNCTEQIAQGDAVFEVLPQLTGYLFAGAFAEDSSSSTRYTTADGEATAAFAATDSGITVYLRFDKIASLSLDANGGTGGPSTLWLFDGTLYLDGDLATAATWPLADLPRVECHRFDGYFEDDFGGGEYITSAGAMTSGFAEAVAAGLQVGGNQVETIYAHWTQVTSRVQLDDNGGSGGSGAVYVADVQVYSDDQATTALSTVAVPSKTGYTFLGYFANGVCCIDGEGAFVGLVAGATTLVAAWAAKSYTLAFSNGATSKTVTFGAAIGTLPATPSAPANHQSLGWTLDGVSPISASTAWRWDDDGLATPLLRKINGIGALTDWFGLGSASLVPFESDAGDNVRQVVTRHYGRNSGASAASGKAWRNPTVKYMVVGDMTLVVQLGRAFAATSSATGYMITSATVATGCRRFPVVTVQGTANEGQHAINSFEVRVPVFARARAQKLLNAVAGGGELQACTLRATCDPVVLAENMIPCASDVVGGRYELHAETLLTNQGTAPAAGSGGFTVSVAEVGEGENYRRYRVTARKEIV